jgi:hypothetical protein
MFASYLSPAQLMNRRAVKDKANSAGTAVFAGGTGVIGNIGINKSPVHGQQKFNRSRSS